MAEVHDVGRHCRVCGGRLRRTRKKDPVHECQTHSQLLENTFGIKVSRDESYHPKHFCNSCFAITTWHKIKAAKGLPYTHSLTVFTWEEHKEEGCTVSKAMLNYNYNISNFITDL